MICQCEKGGQSTVTTEPFQDPGPRLGSCSSVLVNCVIGVTTYTSTVDCVELQLLAWGYTAFSVNLSVDR